MIDTITLQGFKSFAERARVEFDGGITAIVGPNGSGKSNVVEAIRWATHAARARELRAGKSTELIFHGSSAKAPLGFAEVTLELSGASVGRLGIARRVYRDGAAEQDLGGKPVRARDVHAALRGSGLGPGGLAVIGQGEVGSVVTADARALLGFLEEAAGLSAASSARDETVARLAEADEAFERAKLLEDEVSARVERLARDAESARRHRAWTLRSLALEDALERSRSEALQREVASLRTREVDLTGASEALAAELAEAQRLSEGVREALAAALLERAEHRQELELERAAHDAARSAADLLARLDAESRRLQSERAELATAPPERAAPNVEALEADVKRARDEATRAERFVRLAEEQAATARSAHARATERRARDEARLATLNAELERAELVLLDARGRSEAASIALQSARSKREAHDSRVTGVTSALEELAARLRALDAEAKALQAAREPLKRELARLESALSSYARFGEGPRNALRSGLPGIVGAVSDLLIVPREYETAVTAALGRRLEQVVVEDADVARDVVEHLRRVGGRATLLPLDLLRVRPRRDGPLARDSAVLGNLADLCPSDPAVLSEYLLADTLLVRDLGSATRLARAHASRPRLVTLDGDVLESGGAVTGGRLRDAGMSVLADQRRSTELTAELQDGDARSRQLESEASRARVDFAALEVAVGDARRERDEAVRAERDAERRANEDAAAVKAATATLNALRARLAPNDDAREETLPDLGGIEADLASARGDAERARERERSLLAELGGARELAAAWRAHTLAVSRLETLDARHATVLAEREAAARRSGDAHAAWQERRANLQAFDGARVERLERERTESSNRLSNLLARQNKLRADLEETRLTLARRSAAVEEGVPGAILPGLAKAWSAELATLRRDLDALGLVNARAEVEHAEECARLEASRAQREEACEAAEEVRSALHALERDTQARLGVAFSRVERSFSSYAAELLGGVGELHAERDDRHFLVGVRLSVQPRGKRTRAMNLLSAGERTMAGLAFLFALGHAAEERGLPLAVLDEVDAPLDEANIRRFTRFLEVFAARGTQFILVTHQKATMEVASSLWGVTTDASGASRVLSIRSSAELSA
ncbi:AAA family ATPase [Deinococcus yavapaiensis]|uniref:Chromosome partition protein Smc n=1 Tax=Deinococcus yavapaiensis KR-236 TaxID=694435 RepID=A0A318S5Q4_9DEIO|nr:chromosome segregation SMC family protein [Deinococcus yavapaiensis]PYE53040.1 condensin subunit Smc [Deinococcus yavapaiensis KR-236]